jgi:hypothetical protein
MARHLSSRLKRIGLESEVQNFAGVFLIPMACQPEDLRVTSWVSRRTQF